MCSLAFWRSFITVAILAVSGTNFTGLIMSVMLKGFPLVYFMKKSLMKIAPMMWSTVPS